MSEDLNDEMAQASTAIFTQRGIDAVRAKVHSLRPSKEICECCGADTGSAVFLRTRFVAEPISFVKGGYPS